MRLSIASHYGSCTVESVVALDRVRHAAVRPAVLIRGLAAGGLYQGGFSGLVCRQPRPAAHHGDDTRPGGASGRAESRHQYLADADRQASAPAAPAVLAHT